MLVLPEKGADMDKWIARGSSKIETHMDHTTYTVMALQPGNIHHQSGAYGFALDEPQNHNVPQLVITEPSDVTNHHKLTLLGIIQCLRRLRHHVGHISILMSNQVVVSIILDHKVAKNCSYACISSDAKLSWHQGYTSHMMYDAFLIEKNAKYSTKCGTFWFFDTKTDPPHCCRHKKSCEWYILEAKAVLHQMRHNFLFWKLCNHILSHAALSWHQECTTHMISAS